MDSRKGYVRGIELDYDIAQKNNYAYNTLKYNTIYNKYSIARNIFFLVAIILLILILISLIPNINIIEGTIPIVTTSIGIVICLLIAGICHWKFGPTLKAEILRRRNELDFKWENRTPEEVSSMLHVGTMDDIHNRESKFAANAHINMFNKKSSEHNVHDKIMKESRERKILDKRLGLFGKSNPKTGQMVGLYGKFDDTANYVYGHFDNLGNLYGEF